MKIAEIIQKSVLARKIEFCLTLALREKWGNSHRISMDFINEWKLVKITKKSTDKFTNKILLILD